MTGRGGIRVSGGRRHVVCAVLGAVAAICVTAAPGASQDAPVSCPAVSLDPDSVPGGPNGPAGLAEAPGSAPRVLNRGDVSRAMEREFRRLVRPGGPQGRAEVWALVGPDGRVAHGVVARSTGSTDLDAAALRIAQVYRFEPSERDGCPVPVWTRLPMTFQAR